jgi:hypothetical protein
MRKDAKAPLSVSAPRLTSAKRAGLVNPRESRVNATWFSETECSTNVAVMYDTLHVSSKNQEPLRSLAREAFECCLAALSDW